MEKVGHHLKSLLKINWTDCTQKKKKKIVNKNCLDGGNV
jgi:hypothetical protein